jgi:hypothetical protein
VGKHHTSSAVKTFDRPPCEDLNAPEVDGKRWVEPPNGPHQHAPGAPGEPSGTGGSRYPEVLPERGEIPGGEVERLGIVV